SNVTYSLIATNIGPSDVGPNDAFNVVLTDVLPIGLSLSSINVGGGSCSGTSTITCSRGSLTKGSLWMVTLTVTPSIRLSGSRCSLRLATLSEGRKRAWAENSRC